MELVILEVLIVGLIAGLTGIIWMIVRNYFSDDPSSEYNQFSRTPLSEPHDGEKPHEHSTQESKAAA